MRHVDTRSLKILVLKATASAALVACGGTGDPVPPTPSTQAAPVVVSGSGPLPGGVGSVRSCGNVELSAENPYREVCCTDANDATRSGNCPTTAVQLFIDKWKKVPPHKPVLESELPEALRWYGGKRRLTQRYAPQSDPTSSAFALAYIASRDTSGQFKVVSECVVGALAVSASMSPDGHVANVVSCQIVDGMRMVTVSESLCMGSWGIPLRTKQYPQEVFDQGFVVPSDQVPTQPPATPAPQVKLTNVPVTALKVGESMQVNVDVTGATQIEVDQGDGSAVHSIRARLPGLPAGA